MTSSSANGLYNLLVLLLVLGLGFGLNLYFQRCVGTGHRLGPVTNINWVYQHWDIPPYSTRTIWDTGASAIATRTPTYFRLYGKTLVYPLSG